MWNATFEPGLISVTYHNRWKLHYEPIRIWNKYMQLASSARKGVWAGHDWPVLGLFLIGWESKHGPSLANQPQSIEMQNQSKR